MAKASQSTNAVIGFRVKSGRAIAVLLAGTAQSPQVLDRRTIDLCDPAIPESRQPYHAGMGKLQTDETKVEQLRKLVQRAAQRSLNELIEGYRKSGHRIRAVALVIGSDIDPATVSNPHIRAHAREGRLFRTALEEAIGPWDFPCSVIVERHLYSRAADVLRRSQPELKRLVAELGQTVGSPWRADEKTGALAAWLVLE
jgi:hypothetical protein